MTNIFDYITWRGDLTFSQSPLNEVDNLIFSRLSYFPMDDLVSASFYDAKPLSQVIDRFFSDERRVEAAQIVQKEDLAFAKAVASSRRFGSLRIGGYVNTIDYEAEKQFSALTIMLGNNECFISYRGTDSTLIGWKEDFNMSFMPVVPAQREAVRYFENAANKLSAGFYLGGHSKGGNLAVYASVFSDDAVKNRIIGVFNNDGPGFNKSLLENERYLQLRDRIRTYVPESSVIGMLLEHEENYIVVKSSQYGIMQHDLYSWVVIGTSFVHLDSVDAGSSFINKTLKEWIGRLSLEERERFSNALFDILESSDVKTVQEMDASWLKTMYSVIETYSKSDRSTKRLITEALASLIQIGGRNIRLLGGHEE